VLLLVLEAEGDVLEGRLLAVVLAGQLADDVGIGLVNAIVVDVHAANGVGALLEGQGLADDVACLRGLET
jgi:hypothetical protein